jgi:hypothetical protein
LALTSFCFFGRELGVQDGNRAALRAGDRGKVMLDGADALRMAGLLELDLLYLHPVVLNR